jgi:hypothetical protein
MIEATGERTKRTDEAAGETRPIANTAGERTLAARPKPP